MRQIQVHTKEIGTTYEFHIARKARDRFRFDETFFSITGDVVFSNSRAAQTFAAVINDKRKHTREAVPDLSGRANERVSASEINALGLFHEVLHFVIDSYVKETNPDAFSKLELWLKQNAGESELNNSVISFVDIYPPTSVYRKTETADEFLAKTDGGKSRRQVVLEELILLWLENRNPAYSVISEMVDDSAMKKKTEYEDVLVKTDLFFESQPKYGPANTQLLKMLLAPVEAHPDSIAEQLQFVAKNWESIIGKSPLMARILRAVDFIKEEGKYFLMLAQAQADKAKIPKVRQAGFEGFGDKGAMPILGFRGGDGEFEPENFSTDLSWMPRLVLIAKNIFVWLDQLSKKYQRQITRLDQIPDEELEIISKRGFTGLWLIGIWIRSEASRKIKHLNGNWDAIASAYSLHSYDIAADLGGEEAYRNLKERAERRGIRLASDMVPNHMGIDSTWTINHPDWFLQSDYPPYPGYSFSGPDLSSDERVGIFIEDGYWSKRDAAVVFKRFDRWTGDVKYIYHGNDGTHMPWNDTAQLDFTKPEVREAVIQTILHVARMFPIIRFDAAMVLSKKHYQRLWFPEPGTGGAIPSRSNFSMTREQFDSVMPAEFWREVVDRVQSEAPDTLLLAEAFWLMEGYFVRTLGMHRVYNSAFMNMLKREENSSYRQVIKNILEYNPQILKRFVNFVNNPDEDTAIAQFGKDDKYFGVCVMMATMPGLPMFGHGQIEGFTEKYGMEFKRGYRDERPDENLVGRHDREIFPLLRLRRHFSEVENFLLYDFFTGDGNVNEDVFAYSNGTGSDRSLVIYNNRYTHTAGWIKTSVAYRGAGGTLVQKNLSEGLQLSSGRNNYCVFRDTIENVEYIRSIKSMKREGLYIELGAYKYAVFMNFREVQSSAKMPYEDLCRMLGGRGVVSIEEALYSLKLKNVHTAFYEAVNAGSLRYLVSGVKDAAALRDCSKAFGEKVLRLTSAVGEYWHRAAPYGSGTKWTAQARYEALMSLYRHLSRKSAISSISKMLPVPVGNSLAGWRVMILWLFLDEVGNLVDSENLIGSSLEELRLLPTLRVCLAELGADSGTSDYEFRLATELLAIRNRAWSLTSTPIRVFAELIRRESGKSFIAVHNYDGIRWFNRERFEDLLGYFVIVASVGFLSGSPRPSDNEAEDWIGQLLKAATLLRKSAAESGYRFDEFLAKVNLEQSQTDAVV